MTLLAAVRDGDDAMLVASDSAEVDSDNRSEAAELLLVDKLAPLSAHPLVWGWAGNGEVGGHIGAYLDSLRTIDEWASFAEGLGPAVAEANRKPWLTGPVTRTECLVAGIVGGEVGVVAAKADGQTRVAYDFLFLGWGRVAARVGWLISADSFGSPRERFVRVLETTIREVHGLEPPIRLWRVSRSGGCARLTGESDA